MLKIQNIKYRIEKSSNKVTYDDLINYLYSHISKKYQPKNLRNITLIKKSIDARTKELYYVLHATFNADNEEKLLKNKNISKYIIPEELTFLKNLTPSKKNKNHVLVVGMGPSGLFNAYVLSKAGYDVTLIDRGTKIEERVKDVNEFFETGILKSNSNIQFGEGGAGTFSDGKLGTNASSAYINYVLETFVQFGAPENILYEAKPHIGTDILRIVIINMRTYLISNNVKVLFKTKLIDFDEKSAVVLSDEEKYKIPYDKLILAVGHSAIDIYELLKQKQICMSPKNFAVGVRIEHLQKDINKALYHDDYPNLDPAEYKLVVHLKNRSVYTFCMCPGGMVVNASSEDGALVVNGMSNNDRCEKNANSAVLVNVNIDDYYQGDILDGAKFLKKYEQLAYQKYGKFTVPIQLVKDFLSDTPSTSLGSITPSVKPKYKLGTINDILPDFVTSSLKEALPLLNQKLSGFAFGDAVLSAIETRSSAPIRVERNEAFATNYPNVYAIGEGAGHAGGITTSAIDGIKVAVEIIKNERGIK